LAIDLTIVEDKLENYVWENDKEFLLELDRRSTDYKRGKVKGIAWEDAKGQILASSNTQKNTNRV
jgi:hypothetical protein